MHERFGARSGVEANLLATARELKRRDFSKYITGLQDSFTRVVSEDQPSLIA
jgi:hypothetical protein